MVAPPDGSSPGRVRGKGVPLTLGPVVPRGERVEVAASLWINGLAGEWATHVVERRPAGWKVIGTTGPVAIS